MGDNIYRILKSEAKVVAKIAYLIAVDVGKS